MAAPFIEHRPKSSDPQASTSHFVIVLAGGQEVGGSFKTHSTFRTRLPWRTAAAPPFDYSSVRRGTPARSVII
jgi:hypothetical protein